MPANYCTIDQIKERCLILAADSTYNTQLTAAAAEASRQIDEELRQHLQTPLTAGSIPEQLANITADFGAAIFMRRHMPEKYWELWERTGREKLDTYLKLNYYKGTVTFV